MALVFVMRKGLFGAVAAAVPLATRWAYGHADWPNGRPDGPSRALRFEHVCSSTPEV